MTTSQLKSENAQLRAELSRTNLAAQSVMAENATLRAQADRLKSDVSGWKLRHEVEVSHKQNVQEACDGWREECVSLRAEVDRLREAIKQLRMALLKIVMINYGNDGDCGAKAVANAALDASELNPTDAK